ncbi:MAG TPA: hypothetical protein VF132_11610, partial [Rudaea sp.]
MRSGRALMESRILRRFLLHCKQNAGADPGKSRGRVANRCVWASSVTTDPMKITMTRIVFAVLILAAFPLAQATLRTWPGAAPCDTTLSACITASAADDTVQVATNGPIDEAPYLDKPLTLVAAPGFAPVIAAGHNLSAAIYPAAAGAWQVDIEGFTLLGGYVRLVGGSNGPGTFIVKSMRVTGSPTSVDNNAGIQVENYDAAHAMHYEIADNVVRVTSTNQACSICTYAQSSSTMIGSVHDNRIFPTGAAYGIYADLNGTNPSTAIYSNQIRGGSGSFMLYVFGQGTGAKAIVANNSIACADRTGFGINAVAIGAINASVFNNTVVHC